MYLKCGLNLHYAFVEISWFSTPIVTLGRRLPWRSRIVVRLRCWNWWRLVYWFVVRLGLSPRCSRIVVRLGCWYWLRYWLLYPRSSCVVMRYLRHWLRICIRAKYCLCHHVFYRIELMKNWISDLMKIFKLKYFFWDHSLRLLVKLILCHMSFNFLSFRFQRFVKVVCTLN